MAIEDESAVMRNYTVVTLWRAVPPFLLVLGITGNIITIIVLLQKRLRNSPLSMFLSALALSDILALLTGLLRQWIKYTFNVDMRKDSTEVGCKFHWFFVYVATQFSSWMLVCVTVERVISTYLPNMKRVFCKTRIARVVVCIILGCLIVLNTHFLFGYGDRNKDGNETQPVRCVPIKQDYSNFVIYTWTWIDFCVFYLLPVVVLFIGNGLIIYKVVETHRRSHPTDFSSENSLARRHQKKISNLTVLLLLVSTVFVVCITPIVVFPIGEPYWQVDASEQKLAIMFLIETMANLLMYVNHSVNFVLYFLSGSKFRNEVKRIICRKKESDDELERSVAVSKSIF